VGAFLTADGLLALATLTAMEIVLGIDNVVFIAIMVGRLPEARREVARRLGLVLALGIRVGLLLTISWMMGLTAPLVSVLGRSASGRDLILIGGGLFLLYKSTGEIHQLLEGEEGGQSSAVRAGFAADLALFDPATVRDQATFPDPHRHPVGIPYVVVNGQVVVDGARYHAVPAGRVLTPQ